MQAVTGGGNERTPDPAARQPPPLAAGSVPLTLIPSQAAAGSDLIKGMIT
jgi:hypothetical protein